MQSENRAFKEGYVEALKTVTDVYIPLYCLQQEYGDNEFDEMDKLKQYIRGIRNEIDEELEKEIDTGVNGRIDVNDFPVSGNGLHC